MRGKPSMKAIPIFRIRSLVHLPISATQSRIEVNISSDPDVESSDESLAFSFLIQHRTNSSAQEILSVALKRALDILDSQRSAASRMH
jgi:hypothetical protein